MNTKTSPTPDADAATAPPPAGRVALVTGGARRLGAAIATRLHAGGASIALHYRSSASAAEALVTRFNALRAGSAAAFSCNLLDIEAMPALVAAVTQRFGR
ncbi:MAG TPA: SDR family NAD(P)-dependent oxidoreductase, partial [Steroidobacteraceae bacterium]|nr:SDR family NAD(P)-dependent oxidoreductase [Steroidobacteraceae bacterium]